MDSEERAMLRRYGYARTGIRLNWFHYGEIHAALVEGRKDIAQYLLDQGADPEMRNNLGISPRQIKLFNDLRHLVSSAPKGGLDNWLHSLVDEPGE